MHGTTKWDTVLDWKIREEKMEPTTATPSAARTDTEARENQNQTGITVDTLRKTLLDELQATHVEIEDMSGILMFISSSTSSYYGNSH